jgi:hypothetical protein
MPLTPQNSEEQTMFDLIQIAGWTIEEQKHSVQLRAPNGSVFGVERSAERSPIQDLFCMFTQYNQS